MQAKPNRAREFMGLIAMSLLALGAGALIERFQGEDHERWFAIAVVVSFLGLAIGVVNWVVTR